MPTDTEQLVLIRNQALASIAQITAHPKPSYTVDGQAVSWNSYLRQLRLTVDWCQRQLAEREAVEIRSQATT